ncbi:SDR family NAD(P)-dependent oxidoreductase [Rhabdobacter roseus]|uniref:NAD(P)-dependent dehydrogenase (Short-subunit alcohol dehydrogenase family) n=1 Tax=Rhabdobacter roseus TaxID=1655419 RepID=A0A840TNB9_9BACT|nr:SDR family NAD(P)-dependent oxidoreductase [Rhabdobacter roseus]MBB5285181.1 NAD(P)-dependent dehydrogenase (short-subunit alcohol dehydrogenase family) [Rhabdobacter roseus]
MDTKKVWLVTGASKGLGLFLVKKLLNEGYQVAATSRNVESLEKEVGISASFLPLEVHLTDEKSVSNAITKTLEAFGTIDVVVNNAGYGQIGALEELSDQEARQNFDINVFGSLTIIRNVMPHFRSKKSGHIINIASIAGLLGTFPGFGIYCATKFAMVGFTESLSAEVKEFGIKATVVYPGYFRTNFLDKGSLNLPQNPIEDYTAVRNSERWHESEMKGNQPGSPEKAALAFIQLAESENPPLHFIMGSDAFGMAKNKIEELQNELSTNEALSKSTDF